MFAQNSVDIDSIMIKSEVEGAANKRSHNYRVRSAPEEGNLAPVNILLIGRYDEGPS